MASIINQLNSDEFCRLRLGVGRAGKLQDEIDFCFPP